eukprot:TRINITY_DN39964_c0_g1_i1.p1 TRINITY_DN39964_c0_g1~~TRINITY_DN39964_c0_g1_i1.p1  ORF type:complete len:482 (+),score=110.93 TRINITY_DN39964_c0_g1_i1:119-1447(+)
MVDFNGKELCKIVPDRHRNDKVFMYSGALAMGANSKVLTFPDEVGAAGCPNWELVPDWDTEQELPWACKKGVVVKRVYCEQARAGLCPLGSSALLNEAVPRLMCKRLLEELRVKEGLEMFAGGELEFSLVKKGSDSKWQPLFTGVDIFATLQSTKVEDYFYRLDREMLPVGVDIKTLNCEYGEGQVEVTFAPQFGIKALDGIATFRTGAKEIAQQEGFLASFMAKPFGVSGVGNGGHFNFSLWGTGEDGAKVSAFHSSEDPHGLSAKAKSFLAGVLKHSPALEAICSSTPPCYTRQGNWAPTLANWGIEDRTACVRVKADPKGSPSGCYMEFRMPSAAANAYLVAAGLIAAGLDGIESCLELPHERMTKEDGAMQLPSNLPDALEALKNDDYMTAKLGPDFVRWFRGVKFGEMEALDARIKEGNHVEEATSAAWQDMYMEYV